MGQTRPGELFTCTADAAPVPLGEDRHCFADEGAARAGLRCRSNQVVDAGVGTKTQTPPNEGNGCFAPKHRFSCAPVIDCTKSWQDEARQMHTTLTTDGICPPGSTGPDSPICGSGTLENPLQGKTEMDHLICSGEHRQKLRMWRAQFYRQCWRQHAPDPVHPNNPYTNPPVTQATQVPFRHDSVLPSNAENRLRQEVYYTRYLACSCTKLHKPGFQNHRTDAWNFGPDANDFGGGLPSGEKCDQYSQFVAPAASTGGDGGGAGAGAATNP